MSEPRIKVIRLPSFFQKRQFSAKMNCSLIPPFGMSLICSYLRARGITLDQYDLNIEIHYDCTYFPEKPNRLDKELFFDADRVLKYSQGAKDNQLDLAMEIAAAYVKISKNDILLLSLPDNIENDSNMLFALAFSKFIKENYSTINILGGESLWLDLLRKIDNCNNIDYIVYGEGEIAAYHLLNHIIHNQSINNIPGISLSSGGKVLYSDATLKPIKPDFNNLVMEKYGTRIESLEYSDDVATIMENFQKSATKILPYRFMKGCPFDCIFCVSSVKDLKYVLTPQEIVQHLSSLQNEFNPTGFFFLHDTINISRKFINSFCDELIKNKVKIMWSDCARVDNLDRDTIFKMREAGCIRLIYGMETASERLLKYINKNISLDQLANALKWSDQAGIWNGIEVICGLPQEKEEDVTSTISFINENHDFINRVYLNHFDLRQNTLLYNYPTRYGIENIQEVNQHAKLDFISYVRFGFDEIRGLRWNDKMRQIQDSLQRVQNECGLNHRYFTDEHLLFYLYSNIANKKDLVSIYAKVKGSN